MFSFKKFSIKQDRAAMKVCTDSCLFAALVSVENKERVLDIGCGTGLLSLMLAQKNKNLRITAIEINADAVLDASENIQDSPFRDRISLVHQSVQDFSKKSEEKFDLIVCNPPFYQNNLKSDKSSKNIAHHADELTFYDLAYCLKQLLTPDGSAWLLLPPFEMNSFLKLSSENGFFPKRKYLVKHSENKPVFREIVELQRIKTEQVEISPINIYENHQYSPIFVELLRDYYLIF
jgi:tRNA1Val (adenine37-N6)-methyltransferase